MIHHYLAQAAADDPIGQVSPPVGWMGGSAPATLGNLFSTLIKAFILVAGITLLIYLLWGAFDWITSGGEKDKVAKAQQKISNAVIGMILVIVVMTVFGVVSGDMLGIVCKTNGGWTFKIPTVGSVSSGCPTP